MGKIGSAIQMQYRIQIHTHVGNIYKIPRLHFGSSFSPMDFEVDHYTWHV